MSAFNRPLEVRCGYETNGRPCRKVVGSTQIADELGPCLTIWADNGGTGGIPDEHKKGYGRAGLTLLIDADLAAKLGYSALGAVPDGFVFGCGDNHATTINKRELVTAVEAWFQNPEKVQIQTQNGRPTQSH